MLEQVSKLENGWKSQTNMKVPIESESVSVVQSLLLVIVAPPYVLERVFSSNPVVSEL